MEISTNSYPSKYNKICLKINIIKYRLLIKNINKRANFTTYLPMFGVEKCIVIIGPTNLLFIKHE